MTIKRPLAYWISLAATVISTVGLIVGILIEPPMRYGGGDLRVLALVAGLASSLIFAQSTYSIGHSFDALDLRTVFWGNLALVLVILLQVVLVRLRIEEPFSIIELLSTIPWLLVSVYLVLYSKREVRREIDRRAGDIAQINDRTIAGLHFFFWRPWSVRLKYFFYRHHWVILFPVLPLLLLWLIGIEAATETILTLAGTLLSISYFVQKQKLEEQKIMRDIFRECNDRYNNLCPKLEDLIRRGEERLSIEDKVHIGEYLNLCGEEYHLYSRGLVDPRIWEAWSIGMVEKLSKEPIRSIWLRERQLGSYYGLPL